MGCDKEFDTRNKAFGCRVGAKEDKPTNGECIAMIADKLPLKQRTAQGREIKGRRFVLPANVANSQ